MQDLIKHLPLVFRKRGRKECPSIKIIYDTYICCALNAVSTASRGSPQTLHLAPHFRVSTEGPAASPQPPI